MSMRTHDHANYVYLPRLPLSIYVRIHTTVYTNLKRVIVFTYFIYLLELLPINSTIRSVY